MVAMIERAKMMWDILVRGAPAGPVIVKKAPFLWPSWQSGQPSWHMVDFQAYVKEGYDLNSLIYSAVNYKGRSLASAPLRAYDGDPDNPTPVKPNHALAKLVARPNPYMSWRQFFWLQIAYFNVAGNAYHYLDRPNTGALPTAIYPLRPDRVFIIPGDGGILGYKYVPEGMSSYNAMPIVPADMMHVKLPYLLDPFEGMGYGLSPMSPLAQSADVDNDVTEFLKNFFEHGAVIPGILKFNIPMTKETVAEARRRWMELYGGVDNWSQVAVLDQGGEYQKIAQNFQEMGFEALDKRNESRILGPFGVPPILTGTNVGLDRSTYSNYEEARKACWEDTLLPEQSLFMDAYQYYLQTDDGAFVMFDNSNVPALRKNVPTLITAAYQMWQMGTPRDTAYAAVGLSVPETPNGKISYTPIGMVPSSGAPRPTPATNNQGAAEAADETRKALQRKTGWSAEQKAAIWKKVDSIATSWEESFAEAARKQFEVDMKEILVLVTEHKKKALRQKASINWEKLEKPINEYLDEAGADGWREAFAPLIKGVMGDQGEEWAATLGVEFDVRNLEAEQWFQDYTLQFAQPINDTTKKDIKAILAQANAEGWSVPTMQDNLTTTFQQYMDGDLTSEDFDWYNDRMPPYRTELISRVESMRASNAGSQELFESWGVKGHEWLATQDDRTRDTHLEADGQVQDIDTPFEVGGYDMMYPLDMSMGADMSEVANCRCAVLPVLESD